MSDYLGDSAIVDQHMAAIAECESKWPLNSDLYSASPGLEIALLQVHSQDDGQFREMGKVYLHVPRLGMAEALPTNVPVETRVQQIVTWGDRVICDLCAVATPVESVVILPMAPRLYALILCAACVSLHPDAHITTAPEEEAA